MTSRFLEMINKNLIIGHRIVINGWKFYLAATPVKRKVVSPYDQEEELFRIVFIIKVILGFRKFCSSTSLFLNIFYFYCFFVLIRSEFSNIKIR